MAASAPSVPQFDSLVPRARDDLRAVGQEGHRGDPTVTATKKENMGRH